MRAERRYRVLNVRSTLRDDDRTARARIRDAAIACFAERGVAATTVRTIAASAGVSPGLVIHHYGSKDGLRVACDEWIAARIYEVKQDAIDDGRAMSPLAAVRAGDDGPPITAYLARTLVDDSQHVAELVDAMVANAVAMSEQSVANGLMNPTDDEYARATVITIWSLGSLVLHRHLKRLLGEDLIGDLEHSHRYLRTSAEILTNPPLTAATRSLVEADFAPPRPADPGRKDAE